MDQRTVSFLPHLLVAYRYLFTPQVWNADRISVILKLAVVTMAAALSPRKEVRFGLNSDCPPWQNECTGGFKLICRRRYQMMKSPKIAGITGRLCSGEPKVF